MDIRMPCRRSAASSRTTRSRRAQAAAVCLVWAATLAPNIGAAETDDWAEAAQAYEKQHFAAALAGFERLALQGDCDAARRAGLMLYFGAALYGDAVPRDTERARRWLRMAADGGSGVARHLLGRTDRFAGSGTCVAGDRLAGSAPAPPSGERR